MPDDQKITMNQQEIDALFEHNVQEINKMNVSAGSMIKGLIMELERKNRNTYIKLRDAEEEGHKIYYDFVSGKKHLVARIARALGFKTVTDELLEVRHV